MIQRMILRVPVGENIFFSFRKNKLLCHTFYDKIEVFFGAHAQALWLCGCADIGRRGCLALFFAADAYAWQLLSTSRDMKRQKIRWFYHKPYDTTIFVRV